MVPVARPRTNPDRLAKQADFRLRNQKYVWELKRAPCSDCGTSFHPVCMDFDHVRGEKVKTVAMLCRENAALSRIEEEIEKCELVCSNCHRLRTYQRKADRLNSLDIKLLEEE